MIHINYQLNREHFKEYNSYLALHDHKTQKRLLMLMCSLIVVITVIAYLIWHFSLYMVLVSLIGMILIIVLFPKYYWSLVFKRIDHFVDQTKIKYHVIDVKVDKDIHVIDGQKQYVITFEDIENIDYTKNDCLVFYRANGKINTLIIPHHALSEEELKEFHFKIMEEINHVKRRVTC